MNDPNVGKVWKSVRVGQEVYTKLEEDAMLAGAGEEDDFIKCFDDITGKELPWKFLRELGVYEKVDEGAAVAKVQRHATRHEVGRHCQSI